MILIGFVQLDKFASIWIEHNSLLTHQALKRRLTAQHVFTGLCSLATVVLWTISVKRLFAVQFNKDETKPTYVQTYLFYMRIDGLCNGILYCILTVLLITVTVLIMRTMNSGSQYQILLRRMTAIFALSYGIRAIFLMFYGYYDRLIPNTYVR